MLDYDIEVRSDWIEIKINSLPQMRHLRESVTNNGRYVFRAVNTDYGWSLHGPVGASEYNDEDAPFVVGGQLRTPVHRRLAKMVEALDELWMRVDDGATPIAFVGD